jgi:hypothetical protein
LRTAFSRSFYNENLSGPLRQRSSSLQSLLCSSFQDHGSRRVLLDGSELDGLDHLRGHRGIVVRNCRLSPSADFRPFASAFHRRLRHRESRLCRRPSNGVRGNWRNRTIALNIPGGGRRPASFSARFSRSGFLFGRSVLRHIVLRTGSRDPIRDRGLGVGRRPED